MVMMACHQIVFVNLALLILSFPSAALRQCHLDEFHYEYTECDSEGGRWRVSVPKVPGECEPANSPSVPLRGKECTFACSAGEFLDIQGDQECHPCPLGTYSLGGGIRFQDWDKIPPGFSVKTEHVSRNGWLRKEANSQNCSRSEWTPRGKYVMSVPGQCPTNLYFSAKLVRAGKVIFEYQYTDPEVMFHFTVQNDQCQAIDGGDNGKWPKVTSEGKWSSMVVNLKSGMNVLQWKTIGSLARMSQASSNPVLIRKIEVIGVAYTSECSKCPNGTYSSGGTSFCQECPANTFSEHGSNQCKPCKGNEYSDRGSSSCKAKPPCTVNDYFAMQVPCNSEGKTQKIYQWRTPRICDDQGKDSVVLPSSGPLYNCPNCNKGMYQVNISHCDFCPANHYVFDATTCIECQSSTAPDYGLNFENWISMPPNISSHCITLGGDNLCSESAGWLPEGDHVVTNFGPSDFGVFLVLLLRSSGFRGEPGVVDGKPIALASIEFELEMHCETICQLLLLSDENGHNVILQSWEQSMEKTKFTNEIFTNESVTLTWVFQPDNLGFSDSEEESEDSLKNYAKIYSIKLTNTVSGGATRCNSCPEGKTDDGCIPCPDGHYMDTLSQTCQPCPVGTVLPSTNAWGKDACKSCGHGLHPYKGRSCKSDCKFTDDAGRSYDFTTLDGVHFISGARLFTGSGTQYYHGFNMSLCNYANQPLPTCVNNVTADSLFLNQPGRVSGMVCRSTLVPQGDPEKPLISTQPVSLGSHLTKIVTNISLADMYKEEGFDFEDTERDIHFYYESGSSTSACPNGRTSIVSLHCDVEATGSGKIKLPPKCSDGTCDGCVFHFLWSTRLACPTCRKEDYKVVRGECVEGEQEIHYFPPSHCLQLPASELTPNTQKCRVLPFVVMIAIPVAISVGLILILLLVYCWSRNKKLEYKYMKLVETAGGQDGELPAADTCGMEDDEEDVHYSDERSLSFFGKIRNKLTRGGSRNEDDNPFIAVKMSEKMTLT